MTPQPLRNATLARSTKAAARLVLAASLLTACGGDGGSGDGDAAEVGDAPDTTGDSAGDVSVDAELDGEPSDGSASTDVTPDAIADADTDADTRPYVEQPLVTADEALDLVDPFIGSGGVAFGYASLTPAAQRPSGFVKLGPDTTNNGFHAAQNHFSGYLFDDPQVRGFSHVRLVGTGAADLGNLRILPVRAANDSPWRQFTRLDKATEVAHPGYYAVTLPDEGVSVELTTAMFSAIHRYTFAADGGELLIDPASSITDADPQATITVDGDHVTGSVDFAGGFATRGRRFTLYYDIVASVAPADVRVWNSDGVVEGGSADGPRAGAVLGFDGGGPVELRVGLSLVDAAGAAANREAELGELTFEQVREGAAGAWREKLGRVRVGGGTERERTMFYTALYNAYRMPTRLDELDGRYRGHDGEVHTIDQGHYVSDLSLWDTYRTLHPWYSLTDPDLQRDCLRSLLLMAEQGEGRVPRWPSMLNDTGSMIGSSADIVFGDAAAKGIDGIDWNAAYTTLRRSAEGDGVAAGRDGVADYIRLGFLPDDLYGSSVSKTVEYAWDDFGLASVADAAGRSDQADALRERARRYTQLVDPASGLLFPRTEAGPVAADPGQVYMGGGPYTEGSAWHWSFAYLHDPAPMLEVLGAERIHGMLDELFEASSLGDPGRPNNALPGPLYWHGNEPMIHAAYLYHVVGDPDRSTYWARQIMERLYDDTPAGLPGNDDGGTMSAWYLFSALGLFPAAGSDVYFVTAPLFDDVEIDLPDGSTLRERTNQPTWDVWRRGAATRNGDPLEWTLRHADLLGGVELDFTVVE
ncbi:MAG: glycoside hydrolase family 92 protein [Myxococcales bacterium]|nr:glycoside hydrolase family 92 protein [Myxococcales bacterium]MCB9519873.1 glycoside hydrolase family 92 protein [Myxococcales bacterium]MCB9533220.1 glycoside hydrolase family 92 protein [Myxococcales bacterium]